MKRDCTRVGQLIQEQDMFGSNVQFKIGGKHKITSFPGLLLTLVLTLIILSYASVRFKVMVY